MNNLPTRQLRVKKYKVIYGNLPLQTPLHVTLNESTSNLADSSANLKRKYKYLIVGAGNGKERSLSAQLIVNWHNKTAQIKKAIKKAKTGTACVQKNRGRNPNKVRRQNGNRH